MAITSLSPRGDPRSGQAAFAPKAEAGDAFPTGTRRGIVGRRMRATLRVILFLLIG